MKTKSVTCIIPSKCSKKTLPNLRKCLKSVNFAASGSGFELNIVIVTNNERGEKTDFAHKNISLIFTKKDTGFSEMNNRALDFARKKFTTDYYLLINDDALVHRNFFTGLKKLIKNTKFDFLNPMIFTYKSHNIDSYGVEYFSSGYAKNIRLEKVNYQLATATCLIARADFIHKIKKKYGFYFNETLGSYLEDVELSIRAMAIGGKIMRDKRLVCFHLGSATWGRKSFHKVYFTLRNIYWVIIMNWPVKYIFRNLINIIVIQFWAITFASIAISPFLAPKVFFETMINMKKLVAKRRKIIRRYNEDFNFISVFSKYAFRSKFGFVIKLI